MSNSNINIMREDYRNEVRKNRLNDLSMQGIRFIKDTAEVIDLDVMKFITDYGDDSDILLKVYAVLETKKDEYKGREYREVGYYVAWLYSEDEENDHLWASYGWIRESLEEVDRLGEAIKKLNLKTCEDYLNI